MRRLFPKRRGRPSRRPRARYFAAAGQINEEGEREKRRGDKDGGGGGVEITESRGAVGRSR